MRLYTVFRFDSNNFLYCEVRRRTDRYIAGEVINGAWNFYYDIKNEKMYAATRREDQNDKNFLANTKITGEVVYNKTDYRAWLAKQDYQGDYLGRDYNAVIAWAEYVLKERENEQKHLGNQ